MEIPRISTSNAEEMLNHPQPQLGNDHKIFPVTVYTTYFEHVDSLGPAKQPDQMNITEYMPYQPFLQTRGYFASTPPVWPARQLNTAATEGTDHQRLDSGILVHECPACWTLQYRLLHNRMPPADQKTPCFRCCQEPLTSLRLTLPSSPTEHPTTAKSGVYTTRRSAGANIRWAQLPPVIEVVEEEKADCAGLAAGCKQGSDIRGSSIYFEYHIPPKQLPGNVHNIACYDGQAAPLTKEKANDFILTYLSSQRWFARKMANSIRLPGGV